MLRYILFYMKNRASSKLCTVVGSILGVFLHNTTTYAHEVYVLSPHEINTALQAPSPNFIATIVTHSAQFLIWGVITLVVIIIMFFLSKNYTLEKLTSPTINKIKKFAPAVAQVTLGVSLLASGYYHALFGIELPLVDIFGNASQMVSITLVIIGSMLIMGILPRIMSLVAVILFGALVLSKGVYMTNYLVYAGEAITILLFGGAYSFVKLEKINKKLKSIESAIDERWHQYKFLIIRIAFGISLIYASVYAKLIHGELALETVSKYHLVSYFHFDPMFLVLGAMLIEILLGICFLVGFEIRFASLFFLVFLVLSLGFFGEVVWPHFVLIGTSLAMFIHGYDKYCLSVVLSKRKDMEPVL